MSDGYWREPTVIGLSVVAIIALFLALSRGEEGYRQPAAQSAGSDANFEAHQSDPVPTAPATSEGQTVTKQPEWWDRRDLKAQEAMAFWTKVIAGLTFAGVALLGWTLWETRKVTEETRRIGEAQTRAYLTVFEGEYKAQEVDRTNFSIKIVLRNTGSSPAKNIVVTGTLYVSKVDQEGASARPFIISIEPLYINEIGARDDRKHTILFEGSTSMIIHQIAFRNSQLVFRGEVEYVDVFDESETLPFALFGQHPKGLLELNNAGEWTLEMDPVHPEGWDEVNQDLKTV